MKRVPVLFMAMATATSVGALIWVFSQARPDNTATELPSIKPLSLATDATCQFVTGERAAFVITSDVTAEGQSDHFDAVMSWQIDQVDADVARVRAVLSNVTLTQNLVEPTESAETPEGVPFFLTIDSDCSIVSKAYSPQWDNNTRTLVSTQLDNFAFALPTQGSNQWEIDSEDGLGQYTAQYSLISQSPVTVQRQKQTHKARGDFIDFGLDIRLQKSEAFAVFDEQSPLWWQSISGSEQAVINAPGQPSLTLTQSFRIERKDSMFSAVPNLNWQEADVANGYVVSDEYSALKTTHTSYEEARAAFDEAINLSSPDYYQAALELGAWLKAHPEDVDLIVAEIHGNLPDNARPTAFLALQLSATEQAREALSILIYDYTLSEVDQARAASALADLGKPTQAVADLLLERSSSNDMASRVSLLGVGSMMKRIDDEPLHKHVVQALNDRYQLASTVSDKALLLDTLGNTGDETFLDVLTTELSSDSEITREHAAKALVNLPTKKAQQAIVARLQEEDDARVTTTLLKALTDTGTPVADITPVIAEKLKTGNDSQRAAMIELLAQQKTEEANQLLVAQFKRETNVHIQQLIGRYLPASALR